MPSLRSARLAALLLGGVLAVSSCGDDSKDSNDDAQAAVAAISSALSAAAPASSAASSSASAASPAADAGGDCGAAEMEVKAATAAGGYVTDVKVVGQCTAVTVSTSLTADSDGAAAARGICEIAAVQAYAQGVGSVIVNSVDGKELAIGIKGAPCIGQP